jgi:hypothetical protein
VQNNQLSGQLPKLQGYYQLHIFRARNNSFTGNLPVIESSTLLADLDLADNL